MRIKVEIFILVNLERPDCFYNKSFVILKQKSVFTGLVNKDQKGNIKN